MQLRSFVLDIVVIIISVLLGSRSFAAEQPVDVPAWLQAHVGEGEGQIAQVVLRRARALYLQKMSEGVIKNPCYLVMDATRLLRRIGWRRQALGHRRLADRYRET